MAQVDSVQQGQLDLGPQRVELRVVVDTQGAIAFIKDIQAVMAEAAMEWDTDCKQAFEVGMFDIDRDTWMATAVVKSMTKWKKAVEYTTMDKCHDALDQINDLAYDYDSDYGLPTHMFDTFAEIITKTLGITIYDEKEISSSVDTNGVSDPDLDPDAVLNRIINGL